jgi:hypothetical protein
LRHRELTTKCPTVVHGLSAATHLSVTTITSTGRTTATCAIFILTANTNLLTHSALTAHPSFTTAA